MRSVIGGAVLCTVLAATACGTRAERADFERAERAGLVAQTRAVPAVGAAPPSSATMPTGQPAAATVRSAAPSVVGPVADQRDMVVAARPVQGDSSRHTVADVAPGQSSAPVATESAAPAALKASAPSPGRATATIGSVGTLSGPVGAFTKDSVFTVGVWVKWTNSRGGLNGHPVRHSIADAGGDPARYNSLVRQMVEEQGVIAFLFNSIGFAGGDLSYVNGKRVPIIGHEGGSDLGYESSMVFTPWPAGTPHSYGLLASLTQPDFTAECISARQAGAQAIILGLDNNSVLRVGRSCARQGYKPTLGMADGMAMPSVAADPIMDGTVVGTKVAPWPGRDSPGLAELRQAFEAVAPGVEPSGASGPAWVSAKVFEAAGRNLPDRPTAGDVLNGLWSIAGDTLGGMTYPLSFAKDQTSTRPSCWGVVTVTGGKFVAFQGTGLTCR